MPGGDEAELRKDLNAKLGALQADQQERLARHRADELGLAYINLTLYPIDPDVVELVPKKLATQAQAVLFYKQGKDVRLGAVNPTLPAFGEVQALVTKQLKVEPETLIISQRSLAVALSRYRPERAPDLPRGEVAISAGAVADFETGLAQLQELGQHITKLSPTELLEILVAGAVKAGASDLHVEPAETQARLRYRIDGVLQDIATFPRSGWRTLLSRVKVLASLKLNVRETPQDGSFVLRVDPSTDSTSSQQASSGQGQTYDIRVSVLPGGDGENIVLRILNRDTKVASVSDLGMKQRDYDVVTKELKASTGLILVTGPTGSGKTTTLASFLQTMSTPELKLITLEDPIEYRLPGVEQTQIDNAAGYTFAKGLRAILRQDPDVIMVGEIRDAETAETALHAALTGHLVFSTLHTNDAPGAIPRLLDLKVAPNILAPAINVIIAQRLVRKVCQQCATPYRPDAALLEHIADALAGVAAAVFDPVVLKQPDLQFMKAGQCQACNDTGYQGRIGIFEVVPIGGQVEELILASADGNAIRDAAQQDGMTTITQDGYLKVIEHITTVEEVERVTEE